MKSPTVCVVDDEEEMCLSLSEILSSAGYRCVHSSDPFAVSGVLSKNEVDLLILDVRMGEKNGVDILKEVKLNLPELPVIMITGYPSVEVAVSAMKFGAANLFVKPLPIRDLIREIAQLLSSLPRRAGHEASQIITANQAMRDILQSIRKVAPTEASVIISGESGTGKELVAEALHKGSRRSTGPLVKINCSALPESLLESELFGFERGSFTGATKDYRGRFEQADGGSLFLDEIGDMSLSMQAKVLRVIQERELLRIGGQKPIRVDVRFIAATNKDLPDLIKRGLFREDLYYRLSVINLHLPPLRERREDILLLGRHVLELFNRAYGKSVTGFSEEVEAILLSHDWPGNIRELRNCMERSVIFSETESIRACDLPSQYMPLQRKAGIPFGSAVEGVSRAAILEALEKSGGVRTRAAALLNMNRKTLYTKMKKLGLDDDGRKR